MDPRFRRFFLMVELGVIVPVILEVAQYSRKLLCNPGSSTTILEVIRACSQRGLALACSGGVPTLNNLPLFLYPFNLLSFFQVSPPSLFILIHFTPAHIFKYPNFNFTFYFAQSMLLPFLIESEFHTLFSSSETSV